MYFIPSGTSPPTEYNKAQSLHRSLSKIHLLQQRQQETSNTAASTARPSNYSKNHRRLQQETSNTATSTRPSKYSKNHRRLLQLHQKTTVNITSSKDPSISSARYFSENSNE